MDLYSSLKQSIKYDNIKNARSIKRENMSFSNIITGTACKRKFIIAFLYVFFMVISILL